MSHTRTVILGALAVSASFGAAVQLASGHDLTSGLRAFAANSSASSTESINRAAKGDRVAAAIPRAVATQTISIHVDRLADTSVLVRIPRSQQARNPAPAPASIQSEERKPTIACEPVVSVLTEIAKRLQPGRCVT